MQKATLLFFLIISHWLWGQHEPKAWVIGGNINSLFSEPSNLGGSFQVNYAYNCYTTFVNEVSVFQYNDQTAFEIASSANLILNNFKKQHFILTGGLGLAFTSVSLSKNEIKESFLAFSNQSQENHLSVLLKIRGLYQFKPFWNFVTSLNVKTLGGDFANFSIGLNYEFPYR